MKTIKKLKNIVIILLCIVGLNLYLGTIPTFAAGDCELVLSSAQGNKGDEVTIKATLQSNSGLAGLQYNIEYDTSALSLVSVNAIENTFKEPVINTENEGLIVYIFAEANSNTRTGDLMEIKFKILDGANNDNLSLKLTNVMGVDNDVKKVNVKTTETSIQLAGAGNIATNGENNTDVNNNTTSNGNTAQNSTDGTPNTNNTNDDNNSNSNNSVHTDSSGNTIATDKQGNTISNDKSNLENNSENKSNKSIIIVVIIIIIVVAAIAGYIIYNKKYKKNNDGSDKNNDNDN